MKKSNVWGKGVISAVLILGMVLMTMQSGKAADAVSCLYGDSAVTAGTEEQPATAALPTSSSGITATPSPSPSGTDMQFTAPTITRVKMSGTSVGIVCSDENILSSHWDSKDYLYYIYTQSGKLVKTEREYSDIHIGNMTGDEMVIEGLSRNKIYYARMRLCVYFGKKFYSSDWSDKKYFVPQPKISRHTSKIKKSSIHLKWKKVSGATNYTIAMRKHNTKKWHKVTTVQGSESSYVIKRFRGKKFNSHKTDYEVRVTASAEIDGNTYKSAGNDYIYAYMYTK